MKGPLIAPCDGLGVRSIRRTHRAFGQKKVLGGQLLAEVLRVRRHEGEQVHGVESGVRCVTHADTTTAGAGTCTAAAELLLLLQTLCGVGLAPGGSGACAAVDIILDICCGAGCGLSLQRGQRLTHGEVGIGLNVAHTVQQRLVEGGGLPAGILGGGGAEGIGVNRRQQAVVDIHRGAL